MIELNTDELKQRAAELKAGDRVRHVKFGDGTVISVVKETRDDKVTVQYVAFTIVEGNNISVVVMP